MTGWAGLWIGLGLLLGLGLLGSALETASVRIADRLDRAGDKVGKAMSGLYASQSIIDDALKTWRRNRR